MIFGFRALTTAVCALVLASGILHAQDEEEKAPQRPLSFSAALESEYTDNRDSTPEKEATMDVYVRPRMDLLLDADRWLFDLYYKPAYRYRSNPGEAQRPSDIFHDAGLETKLSATSRLSLGLLDELSNSDDPSYQKSDTTLRHDSEYFLNRATANARYKLTRRMRVDLQGRHTYKRYEDRDLWTRGNEESAVGSGALWTRIVPNFSMAAMGSYESFDYPGEAGIERDFTSVLAGVGARQRLTGTLRAVLTVGWKTIDFVDSELGTRAGPYGRFSLGGSPGPSLKIASGISHMLRDSDVYPYASQEYSGVDTSVEWGVLKELTLVLGGSYRIGRYDRETLPRAFIQQAEATAEAEPFEGGTQEVVILDGQIVYRCGVGKSLRLYQRLETLDSEVSDSFKRNSTGLSFVMEF